MKTIKERLSSIMKNKKNSKLAVFISFALLMTLVYAACAKSAAPNTGANDDTIPQSFASSYDEFVYLSDFDIYEFIGWHHVYDIVMKSDELKPEMDTLFAIYKTWILESMLLETVFEANENKGGFMIPVEMVKNTVSYLYGGIGGKTTQYDNFYLDENNPNYFWLPDGFSRNPDVFASIELDTLIFDNGVYKFDVVFTVLANDGSGFIEVGVFSYEFEQVSYKDEFTCFRYLGAVRKS